jgi:hypothetical protein
MLLRLARAPRKGLARLTFVGIAALKRVPIAYACLQRQMLNSNRLCLSCLLVWPITLRVYNPLMLKLNSKLNVMVGRDYDKKPNNVSCSTIRPYHAMMTTDIFEIF